MGGVGGSGGGLGVPCPYCGRLFHHKHDFLKHFRTHTGEKPFACAHCPYRSTEGSTMRRHNRFKHPHGI